MRKPSKSSVRTKERYILDSLLSVFKGGHFVDEPLCEAPAGRGLGEGVSEASSPKNYEQALYLTVIGGQKYDQDPLRQQLYYHDDRTFVVGDGRGVERDVARDWESVCRIEPDPDLYGKNARKVNVEQVLAFAPTSPVLLVGNGERVKQARAWLKRANWGREVIEIP